MHKSLKMTFRNQTLKSDETKTTTSGPPHSKQASTQLLVQLLLLALVPINVLKLPGAIFSESKPLRQTENRHGPLCRLRFGLLGYFKGALLRNFDSVERMLLIVGVLQLADPQHRYVRTYVWFNVAYWLLG
jgi:hypothetical protein